MIKKILLKIKYPKLLLLILSIVIAYLIYKDENNFHFHGALESFGYFATFLAGVFFMYGFTAAPAVAILLLASNMQNFWIAGLSATFGSLVGNFVVFKSYKISVQNELELLGQNQLYRWIAKQVNRLVPDFVKNYIFPVLAGFISATPMPDEFSTALIARAKDISLPVFLFFSFFFSIFGIFFILWVGRIL